MTEDREKQKTLTLEHIGAATIGKSRAVKYTVLRAELLLSVCGRKSFSLNLLLPTVKL